MKTLFTLLAISLLVNLQAQSGRRLIELTGTISENYPVKMTLTLENGKILGFYYYEKYKTKILLSGQMDGNRITLNESPDYETEFKMGFTGELNAKTFVGQWIDKRKDKTLNFRARVDSDNPVQITDEIKQLEGNYKNINNTVSFKSSIRMKNIKDNLFCFEISTGKEDGCVGYLKGLIELTDLSKGRYSDSSCDELNMELSPEMVIITEKSCEWHGAFCSFEGKYKKNKKPQMGLLPDSHNPDRKPVKSSSLLSSL